MSVRSRAFSAHTFAGKSGYLPVRNLAHVVLVETSRWETFPETLWAMSHSKALEWRGSGSFLPGVRALLRVACTNRRKSALFDISRGDQCVPRMQNRFNFGISPCDRTLTGSTRVSGFEHSAGRGSFCGI